MTQEYQGGYNGRTQYRRSITENESGHHVKRVSSLDRTTSGGAHTRSPNHTSMSHGTPDGLRSISAERTGGPSYRDSRIRGNGGGNHLSGLHVKSSPVSSLGEYSPTGKSTPQGKN